MSEHDTASPEGTGTATATIERVNGTAVASASDIDDGKARKRRATGAFEPSADPKPDDELTVRVPRWVREQVEAERDRVDAPTDSLGVARQQVSLDRFATRMLLAALKLWTPTLPDWRDPFALDVGDGPEAVTGR